MHKLGIVISDELYEALRRVTKKNGATISNLIRKLAVDYVNTNGEQIEDEDIQWGGVREKKTEGEPS